MSPALAEPLHATMTAGHQPVMFREVLALLAPRAGGRYLDLTFGGGNHARGILAAAAGVNLVALDRDPAAQPRAQALAAEFPGQLEFVGSGLRPAGRSGRARGLTARCLTSGCRRFSSTMRAAGFRFGPTRRRTCGWTRARACRRAAGSRPRRRRCSSARFGILARRKNWRQVVRALLAARGSGQLARTTTLAETISNAIPARVRHTSKIHPATRSFQGIRIAVNDELGALERALPVAFAKLAPGGVLVVISFHSLEDRPVKQYFRRLCGQPESANDSTPQDYRTKVAEPLTRRPLTPADDELAANPRSRSAKLRAVRKL